MSQNPVSLLSLLHPVLRPTLGHEVGNPAPLAEHFTPTPTSTPSAKPGRRACARPRATWTA
ncbi:hypothetical protein [Deinococcus multiflagellatus]|uniref:Uncharacterized protein n=1 Tax=Deinococcus multiflagellatus TaxID=1656887 RepID=A0ABW1ZJT1_9DEIO